MKRQVVALFTGAVLAVTGLAMAWVPLALMALGAGLIVFALFFDFGGVDAADRQDEWPHARRR
jgi:hypothetical protein